MASNEIVVERDRVAAGTATIEDVSTDLVVEAAEQRERTLLVVGLSLAIFMVSATGGAMSPFLLVMARDLNTNLAAIANLAAVTAITWGVASIFAGALSDRLGRKPLIVVGFALVGLSQLAFGLSTSYGLAALARALSGIGGGTYMGSVFAAVADRFPSNERGRALGWLTTGQSFALVLGVPLITLVGGSIGWRGGFVGYGVLMLATLGFLWWIVPGRRPTTSATRQSSLRMLRQLGPWTFALLCASMGERLCYASLSIFLPTFLIQSYGVAAGPLAAALALVALGNVFGTQIGGQLADRWAARALLFAFALASTGGMVLALLLWRPSFVVSIALGFVYTLVNAFGRPAMLAALSDVAGNARGAVLGLNGTFASVGWLVASGIGGTLVVGQGFGALAVLNAVLAFIGAGLAVASWVGARRASR